MEVKPDQHLTGVAMLNEVSSMGGCCCFLVGDGYDNICSIIWGRGNIFGIMLQWKAYGGIAGINFH